MKWTLALALSMMWVASAGGQVADHLKCYKVTDPLKLSGTADLDTPQFGPDAGCAISKKARLFCVSATKTNVAVVDKKTGTPLTPLPISGPDPGDRICYKAKCPNIPADQSVTDPFGNRILSKLKATLLCTPAVKGTAFCGDGVRNGSEECDGRDLGPGSRGKRVLAGAAAAAKPTAGAGSWTTEMGRSRTIRRGSSGSRRMPVTAWWTSPTRTMSTTATRGAVRGRRRTVRRSRTSSVGCSA